MRNHYDRIGHFAQGFVPTLLTHEILILRTPLRPGGWLAALVTAVALAVSALRARGMVGGGLLMGEAADAFLGTQGDPWDTQWDMFCALIGAIVAQVTLARIQDRQLARYSGAR